MQQKTITKIKSFFAFALIIALLASFAGCNSSELRTSVVQKNTSNITREVVETPTPKPTVVETPTPKPTTIETPTPEPTPIETPTPEPTPIETPTPEPTAVETPTPEPTAIETPTPEPTIVEAALVQEESPAQEYVLNKNTKKFHYPNCKSVGQMKEKNKEYVTESRDSIINRGYVPCKNCNP